MSKLKTYRIELETRGTFELVINAKDEHEAERIAEECIESLHVTNWHKQVTDVGEFHEVESIDSTKEET